MKRLVENPTLEAAMLQHWLEKTESSANEVGRALNSAEYLVPVITEGMPASPEDGQLVRFAAGSKITFMSCQNADGHQFLPAFSNWKELRMWAGDQANAFVLDSADLWSFALRGPNPYAGVVINPASRPWTLLPQNIQALIEDLA